MPLPLSVVAPVPFNLLGLPSDRQRTYRIAILSEGFLPQEMSSFRIAAQQVLRKFLLTQPFGRRRAHIFIVGVQCTSLASSRLLTRAPAGPARHIGVTPFDVGLRPGIPPGIEGEREAVAKVLKSISGLPAIDAALVIVNNSEVGGQADGEVAWLTTEGSVANVFLHELGHAGFGLGDEYEDDPAKTFTGADPVNANLTTLTRDDQIPWRSLFKPANVVVPSTVPPVPGTCRTNHPRKRDVPSGAVGLFEGGLHNSCAIFRPSETCRMRDHDDDYCVVCEQAIFERLAGGILDARQPTVLPTPNEEWTHVVAVPESPALPNASNLVAYNTKTGHLAVYDTIDFFSATPSAVARVRTLAGPGFLSMTTFAAGLDQFIYLDNFFTDRRTILKIVRALSGNTSVIQIVLQFERPAALPALPPGVRGFSHVVPLQLPGAAALLHYDRTSGALELEFFDPITGTPQTAASTAAGTLQPWHPLLSSLTPVTLGGLPHVVGVDAAAREVFIARAQPSTVLIDTFASPAGFLMPMQTHALGFTHHAHAKLLTYSTHDGGARVYEIRQDGSGMDFVYGWAIAPGASALFDVGLPAQGLVPLTSRLPVDHLWFYNAGLSRFTIFQLR
jgi:IgA Peptidase M64